VERSGRRRFLPFLCRVWRIVTEYLYDVKDVEAFSGDELDGEIKDLRRKTHQTIKKVTDDINDRFHINTAISAVMELVNALYQVKRPDREDRKALAVVKEALEAVVVLLAPIVPHITEELWEMMGREKRLVETSWPVHDETVAAEEEITVVVQVNGKLRGKVVVPADESDERIKELAVKDKKVGRFLEGKKPLKVIYVPKKLVNIVVN